MSTFNFKYMFVLAILVSGCAQGFKSPNNKVGNTDQGASGPAPTPAPTPVPAPPAPGNLGYPSSSAIVGITDAHCPNWVSVKKTSGPISTTADGQMIENLDITGTITVKHNNVHIRCIRSSANDYFNILSDGPTGLLIEDSELTNSQAAAVGYGDYTANRLWVHDHAQDGFKVGDNVIVRNSYIERLGSDPESHADGLQLSEGTNIQVIANNFQMPSGNGFNNDAPIFIGADFGPIGNVLIQGNRINGGGAGINMGTKPYPVTGVVINNNVFGHDFGFFPVSLLPGTTFTNNHYEDTGVLVNP